MEVDKNTLMEASNAIEASKGLAKGLYTWFELSRAPKGSIRDLYTPTDPSTHPEGLVEESQPPQNTWSPLEGFERSFNVSYLAL